MGLFYVPVIKDNMTDNEKLKEYLNSAKTNLELYDKDENKSFYLLDFVSSDIDNCLKILDSNEK